MESLLANYGSDDDEDEPQQPTRAPLSAFRPTVQGEPSSDIPARRSSLFASLPRPKMAKEDTGKPHFSVSEHRNERVSIAGSRHKRTEENSKVCRVADGVLDIVNKGSNCAHRAGSVPRLDGENGTPGTRVSLFGALPPPKNTGSSVVPLTSQKLSGSSSKRVVELRPAINMALLQETDDDDAKPPLKRHATEGMAGGKVTGLAAILPKPKNLGAALGSGYASGHQATLDMGISAAAIPSASDSALGSGYDSGHQQATLDVGASANFLPSRTDAISSLESAPHSVHESSTMAHQHASESWPGYAHYGESHVSTVGSWEGGANLQDQAETVQLNAALPAAYPSSCSAQEGTEDNYLESYYSTDPDAYSQEMVAHETSGNTTVSAQDALAEMLRREKRKGGRNASVNIVEVKQADLTATKLREDQLRTTGIAFGPAYKPLSTGKNKPSKLHRRKHQIGSLYYDMKQKEMELIERRAKGNMTKAETQAKYGW